MNLYLLKLYNKIVVQYFCCIKDRSVENEDIQDKVRKERRDLITRYSWVLGELIGLVKDELREFEKPYRFVAKISTEEDSMYKSVESIVGKIESSKGKYTVDNFAKEMPDIFRFRIVCNYLSDVRQVVERIKESSTISEKFSKIGDEDKILEDKIESMKQGKAPGWIRLHSLVFEHKDEKGSPKIEIQVMTMLQEAWDKKDHYLFYEQYRKGFKFLPQHKIRMNAMSELLYVADEFFDLIQHKVIEEAKDE